MFFFTPKTIKNILTTSFFEDLHEVLEDYTDMFLKEQYIFTAVVMASGIKYSEEIIYEAEWNEVQHGHLRGGPAHQVLPGQHPRVGICRLNLSKRI
jgi:hypothetical protein